MAETQRSPRAMIRPIVLLLIAGTIAYFTWRHFTHKEGYTGGDVTTTGTVEADHLDLSFKVSGRLAEVPVDEGAVVAAGQLIGRLETQDRDVQIATARAAVAGARAGVAQARAHRDETARNPEVLPDENYFARPAPRSNQRRRVLWGRCPPAGFRQGGA